MLDFDAAMADLPLVAILRGLTPEEAEPVGDALVEAGFRLLEVPLNSPRPFDSIARLAARHGRQAVIGAGTVLSVEAVDAVQAAGGSLVVMPHGDPVVIRAARARGLTCLPGVATPSEAFAALVAGACGLKLFPGELLTPDVVKAIRAVLPPDVRLLPVGGISPERMAAYVSAGAAGFGIGSALYRPGRSAAEVGAQAAAFIAAWRACHGRA